MGHRDELPGAALLLLPTVLKAIDAAEAAQTVEQIEAARPHLSEAKRLVQSLVETADLAASDARDTTAGEELSTSYIKGDQLTSENDGGASR